jgi:hypothetical protein
MPNTGDPLSAKKPTACICGFAQIQDVGLDSKSPLKNFCLTLARQNFTAAQCANHFPRWKFWGPLIGLRQINRSYIAKASNLDDLLPENCRKRIPERLGLERTDDRQTEKSFVTGSERGEKKCEQLATSFHARD